jgi:hypothetical protein
MGSRNLADLPTKEIVCQFLRATKSPPRLVGGQFDVEAALRRHLAIPLGAGSPLQHQIDPLPQDLQKSSRRGKKCTVVKDQRRIRSTSVQLLRGRRRTQRCHSDPALREKNLLLVAAKGRAVALVPGTLLCREDFFWNQ